MKRIILVTLIAACSSPVFANNYSAEAFNGLLNPIAVDQSPNIIAYYVGDAAGTASNKTQVGIDAPVTLTKTSSWTFDFTDLNAVTFTGNIYMGDYKIQINVGGSYPALDGRQSYTGVIQSFSGVGSYDEATNKFTYIKTATVNAGGGASVYSETAPAICKNGATNAVVGSVCSSFSSGPGEWEGLYLSFVFNEARTSFGGLLQGTDRETFGRTIPSAITYNWAIGSVVPVPATVWLFGSSLVGLAGVARRRKFK